jgi:hypothetical protein
MGIRGEIFSTRVLLQNRTYFFNVKENRMGDLYLNIVESKNRDAGGFERQSVVLFAEDLQDFLKGFDDSLRVLEKAIRERKKSGRRTEAAGDERPPDRGAAGARGPWAERPKAEKPRTEKPWAEKPRTERPRRLVAKKSGPRGGRGGEED